MNSKEALERLRELIGEEKYGVVAGELAGATVYFPENHAWQDKEIRNARLKADFYSGDYEISDLAKKYELSISRVYKIVQNRA